VVPAKDREFGLESGSTQDAGSANEARCPSCSETVSQDALFCDACGGRVAAEDDASVSPTELEQTPAEETAPTVATAATSESPHRAAPPDANDDTVPGWIRPYETPPAPEPAPATPSEAPGAPLHRLARSNSFFVVDFDPLPSSTAAHEDAAPGGLVPELTSAAHRPAPRSTPLPNVPEPPESDPRPEAWVATELPLDLGAATRPESGQAARRSARTKSTDISTRPRPRRAPARPPRADSAKTADTETTERDFVLETRPSLERRGRERERRERSGKPLVLGVIAVVVALGAIALVAPHFRGTSTPRATRAAEEVRPPVAPSVPPVPQEAAIPRAPAVATARPLIPPTAGAPETPTKERAVEPPDRKNLQTAARVLGEARPERPAAVQAPVAPTGESESPEASPRRMADILIKTYGRAGAESHSRRAAELYGQSHPEGMYWVRVLRYIRASEQ